MLVLRARARTFVVICAAFVAFAATVPAADAAGTSRAPRGFAASSQRLAPGVVHETFRRTGRLPLVINVARVQPDAQVRITPVLARGELGSRKHLRTTSAMCVAVKCLVAVNGDFFGAMGQPVGGHVSDGEMIRSPSRTHHQFTVLSNGGYEAGPQRWTGGLHFEGIDDVPIDGVNIERDHNKTVLYTARMGRSTRTNTYGSEVVLRTVHPSGPLTLGRTTVVQLVAFNQNRGDSRIPSDGAVLSGHGTDALRLKQLWDQAPGKTVELTLQATQDVRETIGGTPILMRDGRRWFANTKGLWNSRAPRTVLGWNKKGEFFLVTFDGRQPGYSVGVTLVEAVRYLRQLGATDAINLDGGGSTTFVSRGRVMNRPSDLRVRRHGKTVVVSARRPGDRVIGRRERPVANSLVLVPIAEPEPVSSVLTMPKPSFLTQARAAAPSVGVIFVVFFAVGGAESLRRRRVHVRA